MSVTAVFLRARRIVRGVWLGVGVALALVLTLELAYRAQAHVRAAFRAWRAPRPPAGPLATQPWYDRVVAEASSASSAWRPFVYYRRRPFHGRYVNIDSLGRRWTPQVRTPGATPREMLIFGGSPMWGAGLRDSMTIPSRLAVELAARGIRDVAITNFGEAGYVLTQEVIELLLQLRAGARPAVVVFYDGDNDVDAAIGNGHAGATKSEKDRARDFYVGRALFRWRTDLVTEAGVALQLGRIAAERLQVVRWSQSHPQPAASVSNDSLANDIAHSYLHTVDVVEALAQHYGFVAFYASMPLLDPTEKRLSSFERAISETMEHQAATRRFLELHRLAARGLAPAMRQVAPGRFVQLSKLFAADSTTVYLDDQGHTTEAAAAAIAAELARNLAPLLAGPNQHAGVGAPARRLR